METSAPGAALGDQTSAKGVCIICQTAFDAGEAAGICPGCGGRYHSECWSYNGGCGVYGCKHAAKTEGLTSLEIPASHWGREDKACPNCGHSILAAAKRCKHCGATFSSSAPQDTAAYRRLQSAKRASPAMKKWAIALLVFGLIPFTAPLAAVVGSIWLVANRQAIRTLPAVVGAMGKIAVGVAWLQTILLTVIALLNSAVNH